MTGEIQDLQDAILHAGSINDNDNSLEIKEKIKKAVFCLGAARRKVIGQNDIFAVNLTTIIKSVHGIAYGDEVNKKLSLPVILGMRTDLEMLARVNYPS